MEEVPLLPLPSPEERRKLREELMGLTLEQAAAEMEVSVGSLTRWEKGLPMRANNHRRYQATIARWRETIDKYPL